MVYIFLFLSGTVEGCLLWQVYSVWKKREAPCWEGNNGVQPEGGTERDQHSKGDIARNQTNTRLVWEEPLDFL